MVIIMKNIDNKILNYLTNDSRMPYLKIAKEIGVSEGTIRKRVKKLVENGIIKKFTIVKTTDSSVIVGVQINPQKPTKIISGQMKKYGVDRIFEVTGRFDIVCHINCANMEDTNEILERIRTTEGIVHTETFTILKQS